jgi:Cdc6-like AAA superfamily ATPase
MNIGETELLQIKGNFEVSSGLTGLGHEFKSTSSGKAIVVFVSSPSERLFELLSEATKSVVGDFDDGIVATLKQVSRERIVEGPEVRLLLKLLSESQTVHRHSFGDALLSRYTTTVSGAEQQVVSKANHIVFGRRGAGKSMLLLYSLTLREKEDLPSVWLDFQAYSKRRDDEAIGDVLCDLVGELEAKFGQSNRLSQLQNLIEDCRTDFLEYKKLAAKLRREIGKLASSKEIFVYVDDLHLLDRPLQAKLLDILYSLSRGNQVFLKISAIENLTRTYDPTERIGLEVPHDAQAIHLDYNLTTPEKTTAHIEAILDAHARFAGLANIRRLCSSSDVLPRLTWVSAGVPRDAIYLFSQAIQKANIDNKARVTVSNVNQAASETLTIKLRDLEQDASDQANGLKEALETIKAFCIKEKRQNAFLIEIDNKSDFFQQVTSLVQLRLLHVISEGITPHEAGRKYLALILDYGLYIGIRAAQSVELFNKSFEDSSSAVLRKLPILRE